MTRLGLCLTITLASAFVSFGFSLAACVRQTGQARVLAFYAGARSLALVTISIIPWWSGSVAWLEASALGMIIVQSADAIIGVIVKDSLKIIGPAATAIANLAALVFFLI